jgi:2-polyprenyl-6-methoxyphenol hydroxylase-like FAD-dependent oxidoreductase
MLEYRGILDRFIAANPTVLFLNFGMLPLDLRRPDFPHPNGVIIPQARVEALLEERANELGVEIRRGNELIDFLQNEHEVRVQVRTAAGNYEVSAEFLVGCDGGHSTARKELGIAFPGTELSVIGRLGTSSLTLGG